MKSTNERGVRVRVSELVCERVVVVAALLLMYSAAKPG